MTAFFGIGIEACCGSKHNGFTVVVKLFKQPLAEAVRIVDRKFYYSIESSFWVGAETAGYIVDTFNQHITTGYVFFNNSVEIFLRSIDSCFGEYLTESRRAQTSLCHTHSSTKYFFVLGYQTAYTGTASRVAFRNRVEQYSVLFDTFKLHYREVFVTVVAEFAIYFVGK